MPMIATIEGLRDFGTASITSLVTPPFYTEDPVLVHRRPSPAAEAAAAARQANMEATLAARRARKLAAAVRTLDRRPATPAVAAARRNTAAGAIAQAKRALAASVTARAARTIAKLEKARVVAEARTKRPAMPIRQAIQRALGHMKRARAIKIVQARRAAAASGTARMRRAEAQLVVVQRELVQAKGSRLQTLRNKAQQLQAEATSAQATAQLFTSQIKTALPALPADPKQALAPYVDKAVATAQIAADKLDDALDAGTDAAGKLLHAAHAAAGGDAPIAPVIDGAGRETAKLLVPAAIGVAVLWWLL